MRTFIAIELDKTIMQNLWNFIRQLDSGDKNVRWVKKKSLHLTMKFLGDISPSKMESVKKILLETSLQHHPFSLTVQGTGRFPPQSKKPRILWVGTSECPSLISLQKDMDINLARLGFPKEQRPFFPHLTLGRVKLTTNLENVLAKMESSLSHSFGSMIVDKITFFQSTLTPSGADYTVLEEAQIK